MTVIRVQYINIHNMHNIEYGAAVRPGRPETGRQEIMAEMAEMEKHKNYYGRGGREGGGNFHDFASLLPYEVESEIKMYIHNQVIYFKYVLF